MLKIFASISIKSSFSSCSVLVWIWYQDNAGLIECISECFLFFRFVKEFEKCWHYFFNNFVEFTSEIIWSWAYPLASFLLLIQSPCLWLVCSDILFLHDSVYVFRNLSISYVSTWEIVHSSLYDPLFLRCWFNLSSFSSDFIDVNPVSYFLGMSS